MPQKTQKKSQCQKNKQELSSSPQKKVKKNQDQIINVDQYCLNNELYEVYSENEKNYSVMMKQISDNSSKFYLLQLLRRIEDNKYFIYSRFGKIGNIGQSNLTNTFNLENAIKQFKEKIYDKNVKGKYQFDNQQVEIKQQEKESNGIEQVLLDIKKHSLSKKDQDTSLNIIPQNQIFSITHLNKNNETVKQIKKYVKNTQGEFVLEVEQVYQLNNLKEPLEYQSKLENKMLLWYCVSSKELYQLLQSGFEEKQKRIQFADTIENAANYCYPNEETRIGYELLCEVALGKLISTKVVDDKQQLKNGESLIIKGEKAPPKSSYIVMKDLPNIQIPIGKPTKQEKNALQDHNDYFVQINQVNPKFLIKLNFINGAGY